MFFFEEKIYNLKGEESIPQELMNFWSAGELDVKPPIDKVYAYLDEGKIIAAGGYVNDVIKGLLVSDDYKGYNLTGKIVSKILNDLNNQGISHVFLFTKPRNIDVFTQLGFNLIVNTEFAALFERGRPDVNDYIRTLKEYAKSNQGNNVGVIIVNCNPITLGHLYLIETAAKKVDTLHIFVLQEERSLFPFEVRFNLVKKATKHIKNVFVHPSSKYIISNATFPDYFLKGLDKNRVHAEVDIAVFGKIIAKNLNATKRFVGDEPYCPVTSKYNELMENLLPKYGIELIVIKRKELDNKPISASFVRECIKKDDFNTIKKIVPKPTYEFLTSKEAISVIEKIKKSNSRH